MYSMIPFGQSSRQLNSLFDDFERSFFPAERGRFPAFRTDIKDEGRYICRERRYGSVQRSFDVSGIKEDAISAAFEDGVLKLNLPKLGEEQPQSRKISIQ